MSSNLTPSANLETAFLDFALDMSCSPTVGATIHPIIREPKCIMPGNDPGMIHDRHTEVSNYQVLFVLVSEVDLTLASGSYVTVNMFICTILR